MNYRDYMNARDMAWRILLDCGVNCLPVSVTAICQKLGITVKYYTPKDGNDGMSLMLDGTALILVADNKTRERQRFTAAHELGHILLGHVGKYTLANREPDASDSPIEQAANVFASRILAPACVLHACSAETAQDIMRLCAISRPAAEFRAARLRELQERGRFLTSPLERAVYGQFRSFIEAYRSPTSGS